MDAKPPNEDVVLLGRLSELTLLLERAIRQAVTTAMRDAGATSRWLSPKALGRYVGRDPKTLRGLVRAGKLPKPTYQLGPKSPRFDRVAVDAMLTSQREHTDAEDIAGRAIRRMREEYETRPTRTQRRNRT